jgi:hypothetical protein
MSDFLPKGAFSSVPTVPAAAKNTEELNNANNPATVTL